MGAAPIIFFCENMDKQDLTSADVPLLLQNKSLFCR